MARISDAKIPLCSLSPGNPQNICPLNCRKTKTNHRQSVANLKMSAAMEAMKKSNGRPSALSH